MKSIYRPQINILYVEDEEKYSSEFLAELYKKNIYAHAIDNLYAAKKIISKFEIDLIISDGQFPDKKGEENKKNFIPLFEYTRTIKKQIPIIAWSNSTHVHEFCRKKGIASYSKFLLSPEAFKAKKRDYLEIAVKTPAEMAKIADSELLKIFKLSNPPKTLKLEYYYSEPATMLAIAMALDTRTILFKETAGLNYGPIFTQIKDRVFTGFIDSSSDALIADSIYKKITKEDYFPEIATKVKKQSNSLLFFSRKLKKTDFTQFTNVKLASLYDEFIDLFMSMRMYSSLPTAIEHATNTWSNALEEILKNKIKNHEDFSRIFSLLTTPEKTSYLYDYEQEVLNLAISRLKGEEIDKEIKKIVEKYTWIHYTFEGVPITENDVMKLIIEFGSDLKFLENKRNEDRNRPLKLKKSKEEIYKKYSFTKNEIKLFEIGSEIVFIKFFRKGVFAESYYNIEFLLDEIGRRIGCTGRQVVNMLPGEVLAALTLKTFPSQLIDSRIKQSFFYSQQGRTYPLSIGASEIFRPHIVKEIIKQEIKGQVAYPGKISGLVKVINSSADIGKMEAGDILVSRSTNPSFINAMKIAGAFVTDIGGLTCHAAIVARELKIPCVVGTKTATKVLKDGDKVEVDANIGLIKKL